MRILKAIIYSWTRKERLFATIAVVIFVVSFVARGAVAVEENSIFVPVKGGTYVEGVVGQPTAVNPIISDNPIDQDIGSLIYNRLSKLVRVVETEENGRIYIVKLEEGLVWEDGEPLTSDDIIFTLKAIQDPEINSPLYKNWRGVIVERISELQVKFILPSPYVFFENNISRLPIIPKHIFGGIPASNLRLSAYNLEPVGSGPYRLQELKRKRNGFITEYHLVVNDNFFGNPPLIEEFVFNFYPDDRDLLEAFRMREVDGFGISSVPGSEVYDLPKAVVSKLPMQRYYAVFFNPRATSLLTEEDFRHALDLTIDKTELIQDVLSAEAVSASKLFGEGSAMTGEGLEPVKIIDSFKDNEEDLITLRIIIPEVEFLERIAEYIQEKWEDAGINAVTIISLAPEDFVGAVLRERNYEAVIFGNILENPFDLFPFWHSSERFYPGLNLALYSNDDVDTALETVRQLEDGVERRTEFKKAISEIQKTAPASFLFLLPYTYIHNERLRGLEPSVFNLKETPLVVPSDRFRDISSWYIKKARVFE